METIIGQTLGQYRIVQQVGKGGMATVFKAYQPGLDRYVAVKVLPAYYAHEEGFSARFVREAKAIARLDHPHILPVYDFGQSDGLSYIVMKYVAGGTLKSRLGQPIRAEEAVAILEQIADALDHAHDQGIFHRDVKPGNILIDEKGWVYLSDFGLAKMVEGSVQLTGSGVGIGTPAYMSPEQGQGLAVDERTDVYSLGVILYEMLTGRVPYEAETPMAVVVKHITSPLPLPRSVNPAIPEVVERVILKALAKDVTDRYARAGELVQALKAAIGQTPPQEEVAAPGSVTEVVPPRPAPEVVPPPPAPVAPRPTPQVPAPAKKSGPPLLLLAGLGGGLVLVGVVLVVALVVLLGRGRASEDQTERGGSGPVTAMAMATSTPLAVVVAPSATPTLAPVDAVREEAGGPAAAEPEATAPPATATPAPTGTPLVAAAPPPSHTPTPAATPTPLPSPTPLPPTSTPTPIPLPGRLVFHRNPGSLELNDNEIYTYDIQRGVATRLTNNAFNDWIPRWSPDGGRIAFTSNRDNDNPQNYDVWVMNADGSSPQRYLATGAWDEYAAWSPLNNGEIAIATTADNNSEIHVGTGSNLRRLTFNTVRDEWPTWSPDGQRIAHSNYQYDKGDIFVTNVSTGESGWLYGTEGDDNQPAWSPDGRWIVFVQRADKQDAFGQLVLISADGSSTSTLTQAYASNPAWSPDSNWIVFVRGLDSNGNGQLDEKDETDLWAAQRSGEGLVPLVQAPGVDAAPSWTY